jgi:hypothetical protein
MAHLWRAVSGWLEEVTARFGSPARLAGQGVRPAGLRPRLAALEALIRCLVLEAARRLAPQLAATLKTRQTSAAPPVPHAPARPASPEAGGNADRNDPSTWRVAFAWSGAPGQPPRPAPAFANPQAGPRITVLETTGEWTFFRPGGFRPQPAPRPEPVFAGRFGAGPAPRWAWFPDMAEDEPARPRTSTLSSHRAPARRSVLRGTGAALAWALAGRLEAVRRIVLDPESHVRRLALRMAADMKQPPDAEPTARSVGVPPRPLWGSWRPGYRRRPPDLRAMLVDAEDAWIGLCRARADSS